MAVADHRVQPLYRPRYDLAHSLITSGSRSRRLLAAVPLPSGHAPEGRHPLKLDSRKPSVPLTRYLASEGRFDRVTNEKDGPHVDLLHAAEADAAHRWTLYEQLAALPVTHDPGPTSGVRRLHR